MRIIKNIIYKMMVCLGAVLMAFSAQASEVMMTTYYPSINGQYSQFRLVPRTADLTGSCTIGSLYVNSMNFLQYCSDVNGVGAWGSIPGIWTQSGDNIFLTDYSAGELDGAEVNPFNACDPLPPPYGDGTECDPSSLRPTPHIGIGTTTPVYTLTLLDDSGIIAKGTFGSGATLPDALSLSGNSRLIWYPRKAAFRAGYSADTSWDDANIGNYSAAMGENTIASGAYSVAGGGDSNRASGQYANVVGGQTNVSSGNYSAVTGGRSNTASKVYTTISGGQSNIAGVPYATVNGGLTNRITSNIADAPYSTIGGGVQNTISTAGYSNINGGQDNTIGANIQEIDDFYSVVGGGLNNYSQHPHGVVGGGHSNTANGDYTSVGGGLNNTAGTGDGMVDIDLNPIISTGDYSRVSGGEGNAAVGDYSSISGGKSNSATGNYSTIGGGTTNTASGLYSAVGGGESNAASGDYATIVGGYGNIAGGEYSWAGGRDIQLSADADRTFAWGYGDAPVAISASDAFIIAPGNIAGVNWNARMGVRDTNPAAALEVNANGTSDHFIFIYEQVGTKDMLVIKNTGYIGVQRTTPFVGTHAMQFGNASNANLTGGGVWTNGSSRDAKKDIEPLTTETAQRTLDQLSPVTFNYKATPKQSNVGFIAEDVPDIVAMDDRKSLSAMDMIAVLTKAAQSQQEKITEQNNKIEKIKKEILDLQQILGE